MFGNRVPEVFHIGLEDPLEGVFGNINILNMHAIWDFKFFEGQVHIFKLNHVRFLLSYQKL